MLKIVHLLMGAAALLLSFIPSLRSEALPYLQQPDALYLAFFGLLNLTLAPVIPYWNKARVINCKTWSAPCWFWPSSCKP